MTIRDLNTLPPEKLREALLSCCGSSAWVDKMQASLPFEDLVELLESAEEQWFRCSVRDWKEAFAHHPKIGDGSSLKEKSGLADKWAAEEQSGADKAAENLMAALADANRKYEEKFGFIFIVYASGKTAEEMLGILSARMKNDSETEIRTAAEEQNKITRNRIQKLLA